METIQDQMKRNSTRYLAFAACALGIAAANYNLLLSVARLSQHDMTASHLPVMPLVSLVLLYESRKAVFSVARADYWPGSIIVLAGAALIVAAHLGGAWLGDNSLSIGVAGIVVMLIGAFVLIFGRQSSWQALFPLLFLGFSVPAPPALLAAIVAFLKSGSALVVEWTFAATRTDYYREGFVFALQGVTIEIADECSGIRSSIGLLLTTLLAGHLALRSTWQKMLLTLAIIPIVVVKNGVRIATLCLLATHYNPEFLNGRLHREGGFVFYLLGLAILMPILWLLHHWNGSAQLRPGWSLNRD